MPTRLQIAQQVAIRSRSIKSADQFPTTISLTGRPRQIVEAVDWAWREIQTSRPNWLWMRREFTAPAPTGVQEFTAADLGITRFRNWRMLPRKMMQTDSGWTIWLTATGVSDERPLYWCPWDRFRVGWRRGEQNTEYPQVVSIDPQRRVWIGRAPDDDYTLKGEYVLGNQVLVANADVPELPTDFHDLITLKALQQLNAWDEGAFLAPEIMRQVIVMTGELEHDQLEEVADADIWLGGGALA